METEDGMPAIRENYNDDENDDDDDDECRNKIIVDHPTEEDDDEEGGVKFAILECYDNGNIISDNIIIDDYEEDDSIDIDTAAAAATSGNTEKTRSNFIECSASILLPFSEEVAFDAFSDLTRQP